MTKDFEFQPEFLRKCRRDLNMTQLDVAELLGAHRTSVARWEMTGGDTRPSIKQVKKLAEIFKMDVKWFYGIGGPPPDEPTHVLDEDPWLRQVPWEQVQALTGGALRSQGMGIGKLSSATGVAVERLRELVKGALPEPAEVLALRKGLGEKFDPTPMVARSLRPASGVPKRVQQLEELSDSEKVEFLLQKVNRMELELFKLKDLVDGLLGQGA
jgi:transcriptional regulator with XRE-family HTH domain